MDWTKEYSFVLATMPRLHARSRLLELGVLVKPRLVFKGCMLNKVLFATVDNVPVDIFLVLHQSEKLLVNCIKCCTNLDGLGSFLVSQKKALKSNKDIKFCCLVQLLKIN